MRCFSRPPPGLIEEAVVIGFAFFGEKFAGAHRMSVDFYQQFTLATYGCPCRLRRVFVVLNAAKIQTGREIASAPPHGSGSASNAPSGVPWSITR